MNQLLRKVWCDEAGQDIAEYAVMLAVILVLGGRYGFAWSVAMRTTRSRLWPVHFNDPARMSNGRTHHYD